MPLCSYCSNIIKCHVNRRSMVVKSQVYKFTQGNLRTPLRLISSDRDKEVYISSRLEISSKNQLKKQQTELNTSEI